MPKLVWDKKSERLYETGISNVVLYPQSTDGTYPEGFAWDGVSSISENPSGADASPIYADNIKYLNLISAEDFGASIEAYKYPEEFAECDGSVEIAPGVYAGQQNRKAFGLCYRTKIGNDTDGADHGFKLHLVYNALAAPSGKQYSSVNDSPEAMSLSWEITTTPVDVTGGKPTAIITIDSTKADETKLSALLDILYGTDGSGSTGTTARLPLPDEIKTLMAKG